MAFKMRAGNSPNKFIGALMGGLGGAIARGARKRGSGGAAAMAQKARAGSQGVAPGQTSQRRKRPAGLGQTMAKGGYTGFGVAPGQVMGQGRRRGLVDRARTLQGFGGGGFGGALGALGRGANFAAGNFGGGGLGNIARRSMGLLGGGFFKKDDSSFKNVGKTGEYEESSAFQKPKKKKKKKTRGSFLSRWRNRRKLFKKDSKNTNKKSRYIEPWTDKNTKKESIYGSRGGYGR
tara:strand:+ start:269 stop:970 length:702 start_codon:yes stop_codon:yes gene_type:complete